MSTLYACLEFFHTGHAYSAAEKQSHMVDVRNELGFSLHLDLDLDSLHFLSAYPSRVRMFVTVGAGVK